MIIRNKNLVEELRQVISTAAHKLSSKRGKFLISSTRHKRKVEFNVVLLGAKGRIASKVTSLIKDRLKGHLNEDGIDNISVNIEVADKERRTRTSVSREEAVSISVKAFFLMVIVYHMRRNLQGMLSENAGGDRSGCSIDWCKARHRL